MQIMSSKAECVLMTKRLSDQRKEKNGLVRKNVREKKRVTNERIRNRTSTKWIIKKIFDPNILCTKKVIFEGRPVLLLCHCIIAIDLPLRLYTTRISSIIWQFCLRLILVQPEYSSSEFSACNPPVRFQQTRLSGRRPGGYNLNSDLLEFWGHPWIFRGTNIVRTSAGFVKC